jgi:hypothetical protein
LALTLNSSPLISSFHITWWKFQRSSDPNERNRLKAQTHHTAFPALSTGYPGIGACLPRRENTIILGTLHRVRSRRHQRHSHRRNRSRRSCFHGTVTSHSFFSPETSSHRALPPRLAPRLRISWPQPRAVGGDPAVVREYGGQGIVVTSPKKN